MADKINVEARENVLRLIEEKENLEKEIRELNLVLQKNNVGMSDPLVDEEGFPLANVDVYQVRHARHLLLHKQNDHKVIMQDIEKGVSEYYKDTTAPSATTIQKEKAPPKIEHNEPFARINVVHPGSPADAAGIRDGDLIVEFGSVNATNFRTVQDVGTVVKHCKNKKIPVRIKRGDHVLRIGLVPREWSGKGLLGCNVVSSK